mgnify:FL=1
MSNVYTKYITNLVIISISLLLINNLVNYFVFKYYDDNDILLETKRSKLLRLDSLNKSPDYIFIGSSRTQNHIDTHLLSNSGINSYNLGLPGMAWRDHDILIQKATQYANKAIVISVPAKALFMNIGCPLFPLIERVFMDTYKECNVFSAVTPNIRNLFESTNKVNSESLDAQKKTILEHYDVELDYLGNKINYIRGSKDRYVVFYHNGDSVVFSNRALNDPDKKAHVYNYLGKKFNNNAIKYMQYIEDKIIKSGKKVIFVIEPSSYKYTYLVDVSLLNKYIKSYTIDNTGILQDYRYWSDRGHLNYLGRREYTLLIRDQLLNNSK